MLKFESWDEYNLRLVYHLIQILGLEKTKDVHKLEKIKYALLCIIGETEKFILLYILFVLFSVQWTFLFVFIVLVSTRIFIGGSHRKTTLGCFIQSFLSFGVMILIDKFLLVVQFQIWIYMIIFLVIVLFAPVSRQIQFQKSYKIKFKKRAITVIVFWIVVSEVFGQPYENRILIVMMYQSLEIMLITIKRFIGGEKVGKKH